MKIYNSLTRKKEEFIPIKEGNIGIYVCGPTVYDTPHIGHARSAYIFDVIRRYLEYRGYKVRFVRNVTDVDDKIIEKAKASTVHSPLRAYRPVGPEAQSTVLGEEVKKISEKYLKEYHDAMEALGIKPPTKEPKATEYIPKMVKFIERLIEKGAAYEAAGDIYFGIKKAKNYGKLSNQNLEKMEIGARVLPGENKREPLDFALWKKSKENEPSWPSPWGLGRPGWHIECSVMSSDILGDEFDIHGGGIDLIFPHHENEIAQSEGAGCKFARYWIHNGLLTINGEKMAKSLGNFITLKDFLARYVDPDLLKLFFLSGHYRSPLDFTDGKIEVMKREKERFVIFLNKIIETANREPRTANRKPRTENRDIEAFRRKFEEAMDDDFNMPQGIAAMFELVNAANQKIDDSGFISESKKLLLELAGIFGLDLEKSKGAANLPASVNVKALVKKRDEARNRNDFKEADKIRKELSEKGIILEDTKDGTTWRRKV